MTALRFPRFPFSVLSAAVLCACTVGPSYHGAPNVANPKAFVRAPAHSTATTRALREWWLALNDRQLTEVIEAALAHNPDLQEGQARLREASAQLKQTQASGLPKISANAASVRMRQPDMSALSGAQRPDETASTGRGPVQLYTDALNASWELDLFGGTRRAVEAAGDEAEAVRADLADVQVSVAARAAQTYIELRDAQERLRLARQTADLQQQALSLSGARRAGGTAADVDVERLTAQVQSTRATIAPLKVQVEHALDALAVLTGKAPGALDAVLSMPHALPSLPETVPVGDPAALLSQRPDVRAAERRLASSNAQIGEHVADYFPKLALVGSIGFTAADPGHLQRKSNFSWAGVPYLQWNVFDFGRTRGAVRGAMAARDAAQAHYEKTVLGALQDANGALSRYGYQREQLVALTQVHASAQRASTLMRARYRAGASSLIDVLDAQGSELAAQQNEVSGQAELVKDFVLLQKSLGLGWRTLPS